MVQAFQVRHLMLDLEEFIKYWQMARMVPRQRDMAVLFNLSCCIWKVPFCLVYLEGSFLLKKNYLIKEKGFLKTLSIVKLVVN